jgi:hypothetical protein
MADTTDIIAKLKKDAADMASELGHELGDWEAFSVVSLAECKNCLAIAHIDAYFYDPNNEATKKGTIRGSAVSKECPKKANP